MGRHLFRDIVAAALKDQVKWCDKAILLSLSLYSGTAFCKSRHLYSTPHQLHQYDHLASWVRLHHRRSLRYVPLFVHYIVAPHFTMPRGRDGLETTRLVSC
jgi:hypothetical protein